MTMLHEITMEDLEAGLADGSILVIDVREPHEFAAARIPGSENAPLSRLSLADLPEDEGKRIVLVCQAGVRSRLAAEALADAGRGDIDTHFKPGVAGWAMSGRAIERD